MRRFRTPLGCLALLLVLAFTGYRVVSDPWLQSHVPALPSANGPAASYAAIRAECESLAEANEARCSEVRFLTSLPETDLTFGQDVYVLTYTTAKGVLYTARIVLTEAGRVQRIR